MWRLIKIINYFISRSTRPLCSRRAGSCRIWSCWSSSSSSRCQRSCSARLLDLPPAWRNEAASNSCSVTTSTRSSRRWICLSILLRVDLSSRSCSRTRCSLAWAALAGIVSGICRRGADEYGYKVGINSLTFSWRRTGTSWSTGRSSIRRTAEQGKLKAGRNWQEEEQEDGGKVKDREWWQFKI